MCDIISDTIHDPIECLINSVSKKVIKVLQSVNCCLKLNDAHNYRIRCTKKLSDH